MKKITRNAARCRLCDDTIESTNLYDFRRCYCRAIFVDGGLEHLRRGVEPWASPYCLEELSEHEIVLSEDAKILTHLSETTNNATANWILGIKLMKLRPDIAERMLAARDEISNSSTEIFEAGLVLAHADDNLLQAVIDFFKKEREAT